MTTTRRLIPVLLMAAALLLTRPPAVRAADPESSKGGTRVYVSNERSGDVSVIDAAANAIVATIPVGKRPRGIQLSPDGAIVYVALSGSPIPRPVSRRPMSRPTRRPTASA